MVKIISNVAFGNVGGNVNTLWTFLFLRATLITLILCGTAKISSLNICVAASCNFVPSASVLTVPINSLLCFVTLVFISLNFISRWFTKFCNSRDSHNRLKIHVDTGNWTHTSSPFQGILNALIIQADYITIQMFISPTNLDLHNILCNRNCYSHSFTMALDSNNAMKMAALVIQWCISKELVTFCNNKR